MGRKNFTVKAVRLNKSFVSGGKVVVTAVVAVHRIFTVGMKMTKISSAIIELTVQNHPGGHFTGRL